MTAEQSWVLFSICGFVLTPSPPSLLLLRGGAPRPSLTSQPLKDALLSLEPRICHHREEWVRFCLASLNSSFLKTVPLHSDAQGPWGVYSVLYMSSEIPLPLPG